MTNRRGNARSGNDLPALFEDVKKRIRGHESQGDDSARNKGAGQTATGRYQFIESTWHSLSKQYPDLFPKGLSRQQIAALRTDGALQERVMDRVLGGYVKVLGGQTTPGNLYLAHFLGPARALQVINADPDTPMAAITSGWKDGAEVQRHNAPYLRGKTAGQLVADMDARMAGKAVSSGMQADHSYASPLANLSDEDLTRIRPADLEFTRRPLPPVPKDPNDDALSKKLQWADLLTGGKGDARVSAPRDDRPDFSATVAKADADLKAGEAASQITWTDRLNAATEETWLLEQAAKAWDNRSTLEPGFGLYYMDNWDSIESFAENSREVAVLRDATSKADLEARKAGILRSRENWATVGTSDSPLAWTLGTSFLDPSGWAIGFGVGKGLQIAKIGSQALMAGRAGEAAVAGRAAVEGAEAIAIGGRGATGFTPTAEAAILAAPKAAPSSRGSLLTGTAAFVPELPAAPAIAGKPAVAAVPSRPIAAGVSLAAESVGGNLLFTGLLDAAGQTQTSEDYGYSALMGLGFAAGLYPLLRRGMPDTSIADYTRDEMRANVERQGTRLAEAHRNLGPDAGPKAVAAEANRLAARGSGDLIHSSLADVPDSSKLLSEDPDAQLTADKGVRDSVAQRHDTESVSDNTERTMVEEHIARSEQVDVAYPTGDAPTTVLSRFGMESTHNRLINSGSVVLRAVAKVLLESPSGAGGRRRTAAMSAAVRERLYNKLFYPFDSLYHQFRKSEGEGLISEFMSGKARERFNQRVFDEIEWRGSAEKGAKRDPHPAVREAADMFEAGMTIMRREQQHVGTVGHARLGQGDDASVGYIPHRLDPRRLLAAEKEPAVMRAIRAELSSQFQDPRNGFDKAFSDKLAARYLEHALGRARGGHDVPMNLHSPEAADIVRDSLSALGVAERDLEKLMGKFSRGGASHTKRRLKLNLDADLGNGMKLRDLFVTDIVGLYRGYARRVAGEVALAQYGIMGKKGLAVLRKAAETTKATPEELKAFDQIAAEFLNTPFGEFNHKWLDNTRIATTLTRLGGMGFTQFGEFANGLAAVGLSRTLHAIAAMPRLIKEVGQFKKGGEFANPILNSIDRLGGHVGLDDYQLTRMFDIKDSDIQLYSGETLGVASRALRAGAHMQSILSGHRMITAVQTRAMAEQIIHKAIRYAKEGGEDIALRDMGITPEIQNALRRNMDRIASFDSSGNLAALDLSKADMTGHQLMTLRDAVERGASQIIQRTYIGETGKWAHNGLLKMLAQFRTFSLISVEKQWGRNQANYGALKSAMYLMGAMSFAVPIHLARVQAKMVGMSRKERDEYAEKNTALPQLVRATMNYASASGLLGDILDVSGGFASALGGDTGEGYATVIGARGQGQGKLLGGVIAPGVGLMEDAWDAAHGDSRKLERVLPGGTLPYVAPVITGLSRD